MGTVTNSSGFDAVDVRSAQGRGEPRTVALVTDDAALSVPWRDGLAAEGMTVRAMCPQAGLVEPSMACDAIVFVVPRGLTERLAQLRGLRQRRRGIPLLVVCGAQRELDHVLAFEVGADDVADVSWPASVLAARLRALWRQADRWRDDSSAPEELCFGDLTLRWRRRQVELAGREVPLTDGEFDVLWLLVCRAGSTVTRVEMLRAIRGTLSPPMDRSIDSRVYRIRLKLGDTGRAQPRIRGVRNCGYLFSPAGW